MAGLVYVAAFAPDWDEVVGDIAKSYPPPLTFAAPIIEKEGFISLPTETKRMKAKTTELDTSHVPMLSKPKDVAAVIMDAAAKAPH